MLRSILLPCLAATAAAAEPTTFTTGLQKPESVLQDPDTGALYVSNIGEGGDDAPTAKDGNGFVSKLNADGTVAELKFLPKDDAKLNAPKGMAIEGSILYVADIDRVVSFDLESGKQLAELPLTDQKVTFANDLAIIDDVLLLSDTGTDQVLTIDGDGHGGFKKAEPIGEAKFGGANGIAGSADGKKWYLASFPLKNMAKGEAYVHEFTTGVDVSENRKLPFPSGAWDGIAVAADGTIYASDWRSGGVWALAKGATEAKQITKLMQGPADFCLLKDGSALLVPEMLADKITKVPLP